MTRLDLFLLGSPRIELHGQPIKVSTRKAIALAAYLGVTAVPHQRDHLTALLWPELNQQRGRAALRTTLSALKKEIGAEWLIAANDTIHLKSSYWCDVVQFHEYVADVEHQPVDNLQKAVDLYRDGFLAGFTLKDSIAFDEWQYFQTETLQQQLESTLQQLVAYFQAEGDYAQAIELCRHWLKIDTLNETVHHQLMTLYAASGQPTAALRQYAQLTQVLKEELDIPPTEVSTTLYKAIKNGRFSSSSPPKTDHSNPPWNNPYLATSFVGRQQEITQIENRLTNPDCRLLTLIGSGGVGKTRLALQIGEQLKSDLWTTAVFVPLASVKAEPIQLISAIAAATGFQFYGQKDSQTELLNFLKEKGWLLLLDNFEHLLVCKSVLTAILQTAPHIKLLVTSRERLHLQSEWLFTIEGLPHHKVDQNDAVTLFQHRALQIESNLDVAVNRESIAQICQLVEGLPLGIELAAAWVRVLSCPEIAAEIKKSLDFLTTQTNDRPHRQRSLRAVFDHSWQLLTEPEQQALRQLAIFQGDFTRKAATIITKTNLQHLANLVDKSLLRHDPTNRYQIPEALQPFAHEHLQAADEEHEQTQTAYIRYFATFLAEQEAALKGGGQQEALQTISIELDNIRAAWALGIEQKRHATISKMLAPLARFLEMRNLFSEGASIFAIFSDWPTHDSVGSVVKMRGLAYYGRFCHRQGDIKQAEIALTQSLEDAHVLHAESDIAFALNSLGYIAWSRGAYNEARQYYQESLDLYRRLDDQWGIGQVLNHLAILPQDLAKTRALLQESLTIARHLGDLWSEARILNNLGFAAVSRNDSQHLWQECATLCHQLGDRYLLTFPLINLGHSARTEGQFKQAQQYYQESFSICNELGYQQGAARNLGHLGRVAYQLGEYTSAQELCKKGLTQSKAIGDQRGLGLLQYTLGRIAMAVGEYNTAVDHYQDSLKSFRQSQDRQGEAWPLWGLATYYLQLEQIAIAQKDAQAALAIFAEVGDKIGIVGAHTTLAESLHEGNQAQNHLEIALNTAVSLQSPPLLMTVLVAIASWHWRQGNLQKAYLIAEFVARQETGTAVTKANATNLAQKIQEVQANVVTAPKIVFIDEILPTILN